SDWPEDSAYRAKKTDELCDNIVSEFGRLGGNLLLRYFAIRLLTLLLHTGATGSGQALRERVFERLGFGASPLERLEAAAQQIKDLPAFQRPPFTIYIADVEEDAHGLPAGHPLESHFLRLTLVLAELMNLNPDFKYMCSDWLSEEKKVEKNVVREAKPAMAFTA